MDLSAALATRTVVLDGGLATQLERQGNDLSSDLWSARLLADDPGQIVAAHRAFADAGAEVLISASYQASFEALGDDAPALMWRSVELARSVGTPWVAASVGPYGAMLADGSEYRGDYGLDVAALRAWHRRRLDVLVTAGADVLACETIPCLAEVEALCAELDELGMPAWLSVTCAGEQLRSGEAASDAFAMARDCASVFAIGVNCTAPADAAALVASASAVSGKPVVVYPNSGEGWDASARTWTGSSDVVATAAGTWIAAGARLVGGCCRVFPEQIAQMTTVVSPDGQWSVATDH